MELLIELFSYFFISIGSILILIGSIGLLRLPDVFSRIHAVGMIDTAGIGFIILGLLLHSGFSNTSIKLIRLTNFQQFVCALDNQRHFCHQHQQQPPSQTFE